MDDLKNILECLLFVAEEPLTVERLRGILSISDSAVIRDTLQVLMDVHCELTQLVDIDGLAVLTFCFTYKTAFIGLKDDIEF